MSVSDILAAADFYTKKLGFTLSFTWGDPPEMAGVNLGHVQMFLQQGTPSPKGCSVYFVIGEADEMAADCYASYRFYRVATESCWGNKTIPNVSICF